MIRLTGISFIFLIIIACNKDQQLVRQMEGDWRVTEMYYDGTPADSADYVSHVYTFERCKMQREDCIAWLNNGFSLTPLRYSISEKGEKIKITGDGNGSLYHQEGDIVEHSRTTMTLKTRNSNNRSFDWKLERIQ